MSKTNLDNAVNTLLDETDLDVYIETLEDFFECWITHERNDCTNTQLRTERYYAYKNLREFLTNIGS